MNFFFFFFINAGFGLMEGYCVCCLSVCQCFCCTQIAAFSQSACLLTWVPIECVNIFTVMFGAIDCLYGCNMLPLGL